jgi:hypothetical protein
VQWAGHAVAAVKNPHYSQMEGRFELFEARSERMSRNREPSRLNCG